MIVMFIFGAIACLSGLFIVILGILIAIKQWVTAASRYRYVTENDAKAFTNLIGTATAGIGVSIFFLGMSWISLDVISSMYVPIFGGILFFITFSLSMYIYFKAQSKYNCKK